jgi:hypothetical protein
MANILIHISDSHGGEYEDDSLSGSWVMEPRRIAMMKKAISASETSANLYVTTQRNIPEK